MKIQIWLTPEQRELSVGCFKTVSDRLRLDAGHQTSEAGKMAVGFTANRIKELIILFDSAMEKRLANPDEVKP